ncbi:histone-lysine N-methyltransferase [Chloropicon primus]|uniref:Histone-lysine N-methyltransferase, H3 lysine-79 specific n=1 Tax=Chloropicon primus TaxID=1764295 RepID=A0A5B8MKA1_9CHLO|nr:hypothetical protein A3770_04p34240 [Chloropicon primus]UPR00116.1 histone-lysine N-methyltransferase [Chloropicon primus]|eukprot:QDZ20906.1 hypothetical protein A3770_04p34240 [Chloropicon primus]
MTAYEMAFEGLDRDAGLEIAELSHKERPRVDGMGYFYGELDHRSVTEIVKAVRPEEGDVFVDLGSGLGKMVLSTALQDVAWGECRGCEILPELHEKALVALEKLQAALGREGLPSCTLELGDMMRAKVDDATVVFVFATCFQPAFMAALESKLGAEMKPGSRLVLVSKQVQSNKFRPYGANDGYLCVRQSFDSKWSLDCFVYQKT